MDILIYMDMEGAQSSLFVPVEAWRHKGVRVLSPHATPRSNSRSLHPAHQRRLQPRLPIARGAVAHEARVNPGTAARTCTSSKPRSKLA